jgi:hypothetical protein
MDIQNRAQEPELYDRLSNAVKAVKLDVFTSSKSILYFSLLFIRYLLYLSLSLLSILKQ